MSAIEKMITGNIDIWSSAIEAKKGVGRGSSKKLNLYGIKKLRELILDLAMQGLLVKQDKNDEPVSILLEKITTDRTRYIIDNKIKKPMDLPEIHSAKIPYELPNGWEWIRLNTAADVVRGVTYKKHDSSDDKFECSIPLMRANNIGRILNFEKLLYIPENLIKDNQRIFKGDLLIAMSSGSANLVGKAAQANKNIGNTFGAFCAVIRAYSKILHPFFGVYFSTPLYRKQAQSSGKGIGIQNLTRTALGSILIPIPPITEQTRIVTKVNELMALCEQLEQQQENSISAHKTLVETLLSALTNAADKGGFDQVWKKIANHFDTLFNTEHSIDQLQQTILELAVMGKLVPQNPKDEPAYVLLEKIAVEKKRLVKEKKIKKQNTLLKIRDDEKLFEQPYGWVWCRLGELGYDLGGGTPSKSNSEYWGGDIPWVSPKDMKVDCISKTQDYVTDKAVDESSVKYIPVGSLLIVVRGMILSHSFPVAITTVPVVINQDMKALVFSEIHKNFLLLMMKSMKHNVVSMVDRSSHGTCKLVSDKLWGKVIIIPPLKEQYRIVNKVDKLMVLCEQLKSHISEAKIMKLHLADTITEQAIN